MSAPEPTPGQPDEVPESVLRDRHVGSEFTRWRQEQVYTDPTGILFEAFAAGFRSAEETVTELRAVPAREAQPAPELAARHAAEAGLPAGVAAVLAQAVPEVAAAVAKSLKMRDIVCNLLDLFGAPDERLMQHASVTRATLQRYADGAGVRLDGRTGLDDE